MTCIVGIKSEEHIWIGGDSGASRNDEIFSLNNPKVFRIGPFLIGFSGSYRIGQLMQYAFTPPVQSQQKSDMEFLVVDFVDAIRKLLNEKGALVKDEEGHSHSGEIVVGYHGNLYIIESDFHVENPIENYVVSGTGAAYALGALHAMKNSRLSEKSKIKKALKAATKYSAGVCAPYTIVASNEISLSDGRRF